MNPPWKDNQYSLIQWTCSYHKRRYRIKETAIMQWYNPRLWSYRKTWRNVTHPSDVSSVYLTVSRQLGPSNSGQESSAAAVLACAIMPSEVQKNMKKCYPAHPSNVSASRCRGSLLCPSNSRQKGRNTQPPFNPSVGSLCHFCATATHLSYRFFIFETSATALCGTTGII